VTPRTLVTGAGSGIGRALAAHLRQRGHRVVGIDIAWRDRTVVDTAIDTDLTDYPAVERLFRDRPELAGLDAVVANAAVTDRDHHRVIDLPMATLRRVLDVNVTATMHLVKQVLPAMLERRAGNLVFVTSSLGGWKGGIEGDAVYSASKAALESFAYVLALETREAGVNVNTVYPSVKVDTGFFERAPAEARADLHPPAILDSATAFLTELRPGSLTGISLDQQAWDDDPAYARALAARVRGEVSR
jgi:NAD(P)-dependent dehydrogenase (short-subunit alcohol dehydrogenase family)